MIHKLQPCHGGQCCKAIMKAVQALENQDKIYSGLASGHLFRLGLMMQVYNPGPEATLTS